MRHDDRPYFDEAGRCAEAGLVATAKLWAAIRAGHLRDRRDEPCADCGGIAKQHDHRDYLKWWEVDPVCVPCNVKRGRAHPFADLPQSTGRPRSAAHDEHINQFALSMLEATTEPRA